MSKMDPGSNYNITDVLPALSRAVATYTTATVDHLDAESVTFLVSCGTFDTSFVATVKTSDDDSSWASVTADGSGNELTGTLTEAGSLQLDVPNPIGRYSRLSIAVGGTNVFGVVAVSGPKLTNTPSATS